MICKNTKNSFTQIHFIIVVGVVVAADVGNETTHSFQEWHKSQNFL
jgi:hypothetical protein